MRRVFRVSEPASRHLVRPAPTPASRPRSRLPSPTRRPSAARWLLPALLVPLLLVMPGQADRATPGIALRPAAAAAPMTVAVLYFDNNTGNAAYDVLQKGLADMLVTDLASVRALQVVEREKLQALLDEMRLQRTAYFDPKTAQKLGRGIGAQYAITGAFAAIEPVMRIDIRLVEVKTARVIMADKVVGNKDALFELEAALVAKLVRGLDLRARVAPSGGAGDVGTLLEYSQAIDSADKGDLEQASRALGAVVQRAPRFTLAQKRYTEILKRLRLAKKRRVQGLGADEDILRQNIRRALAQDLAAVPEQDLPVYFGYRVARGNHALWQVRKLAGLAASERGPRRVPTRDHNALAAHLRDFFDNTSTFIKEMKTLRDRAAAQGKRFDMDPRVPEDDRKRGEQLGIARNVGEWTFAVPHSVARALVELSVLGVSPFWVEVERFTVRPTLAELDPGYARKALALLADARREIEKHETGESRERALAELVDLHAESLLYLGRREEAIAQWQGFLDKYPKATQYEAFEAKIEDLLGISAPAQAFQAALASCSSDLASALYAETIRVARAEGKAGLRRLVDAVERTCNRGPADLGIILPVYFHVAREAAERGDCALYKDLAAKAQAINPAYGKPILDLAPPCP